MLGNEPFALLNHGLGIANMAEAIFTEADIAPPVLYRSTSYVSLYSFVKMGLASTMLLDYFLSHIFGSKNLYFHLDTQIKDSLTVAMAWRADTY